MRGPQQDITEACCFEASASVEKAEPTVNQYYGVGEVPFLDLRDPFNISLALG